MKFNLFGPPVKKDIRVGYIDPSRSYLNGITIPEANTYESKNPGTIFIFRDGNNVIRYLNIDQVNQLTPNDLLSTDPCRGINQKKTCGPPTAQFFGGSGVGAAGNPIVGRDGAILGVDLINGGNGYKNPPLASVRDDCNYGTGAVLSSVLGVGPQKGIVTDIIVNDPGNGYLRPIPEGQNYPVLLRLKQVIIENPGINYSTTDTIRITPSNGAVLEPVFGPFGKIVEVKVLNPGLGFTEYPTISVVTSPTVSAIPGADGPQVPGVPTGINASFRPVFEVVRDPIQVEEDKLIQVTDLVGLNQTGYVNGRAYFGSVYYDEGAKFAGFYETVGEPIRVYDTLQESIIAGQTRPPSGIQRQGTDVTSNDPQLNIPGTPQNLI
jgi:hypothetical protein